MNISKQSSAFLKLLFTFLVFNFHFSAVFNGLSPGQGYGDISFFLNRGDVAVSGFLFLSGYALFRNKENQSRSSISILGRNYYRFLAPFFLVASLAFASFYLGYGDIAVKVSGLGYGWSLVMPFGMLTEVGLSDIPRELGLIIFENTDRFTLLGWFLTPLILIWTVALLFIKRIEPLVSKDLAVFVAILAIAWEFYMPVYKGLMSCFILGGIAARAADLNWNDRFSGLKKKLGIMVLPLVLVGVCASASIASLVVSGDALKIYLFNAGFSWVIYLVTEMRYLANLPIVVVICFSVSKMDVKNVVFKISSVLQAYTYPFLLINYLVFSLLANILYEILMTPNLWVLYFVAIMVSMMGAFFVAKIIKIPHKILSVCCDFDKLRGVPVGQK